jgi:hypothetical protein
MVRDLIVEVETTMTPILRPRMSSSSLWSPGRSAATHASIHDRHSVGCRSGVDRAANRFYGGSLHHPATDLLITELGLSFEKMSYVKRLLLAGELGFEPRQTESEAAYLVKLLNVFNVHVALSAFNVA